MEFIGYAIGGIFVYLFYICCWYKLDGKKVPWKNWKIYLLGLMFAIVGTAITFLTTNFVKMILISVLLFFISYSLVFRDLKNSLISVVIVQLIIMISEVVFFCIFSNFINFENLIKTFHGCIIINIGMAIIAFLILLTPLANKLYGLFTKLSETIKENRFIKYTLVMIIIASFLTCISYMHLDSKYVLMLNTVIVIIYIVIMFYVAKTQGKYTQISEKYQSSISSLKEYEGMIEKYRIINHESKSELNRILEMVSSNDPHTVSHIEAILKTKVKENEKIMKQASRIPAGGLRATIYSKLCVMEDKNIEYVLNISKDIQPSELLNINENIVLNMCKILGVFLDNSIEAVENLDKRKIIVELYKDDKNLCIGISNNFEGNIDLLEIDKPKYTTKGNGHGYGLSLVNDIVCRYRELSIEREINKDMFLSTLILNIK